jgi:hypothetical protein
MYSLFTNKQPKEALMTTLKQSTDNRRLADAMKHAEEKPTLSSITLMYVWAYKSKPANNATYIGMLEAVFEYLNKSHWVAMSPSEKLIQWINNSNEIASSGYDNYKQAMDSVLDAYIGNTGVRKHPISWTATVGKPVKVQG